MTGIVDLLSRRCAERQNKTALICGSRILTYQELWTQATAVAGALHRMDMAQGKIVALYGPGTIEFVIAALGTWLAGAAWVPIDSQLPDERVQFILQDAGASVVLDTGSRKVFPAALALDDIIAEGLRLDAIESRPDSLAYVIYTSGSTGRPKGVCVEHGPLAIHLAGIAQAYEISGDDITLNFSSPSFDFAVEEIWLPLMLGATLVLRGAAMWTGPQLFERVRLHRITHIVCPTCFFEAFFSDQLSERDITALSSLRGIIFGGEAVSATVVRRWSHGPLGHIPIYNTYGPTEAVITATVYRIDAGWTGGDRVPIGLTSPGHDAVVLDEHGHEPKAGEPGELYLGGPCLARGYLGRADLTEQRFVRLAGRPGIFYRTGDRVCVADGQMVFLGRVDRQVKIRGFRIELEEIEAVLGGFEEVRGAVVLLDNGPGGRPRLTACVVPAHDAEERFAAHLRERLADSLPAYMVPEVITVLDELPVSVTGKIDRSRLLTEAVA